MTTDYEIHIGCAVDAAGALVLRDLDVTVSHEGATTVVRGRLDQPALHGLLERIRTLGLPLDEVRRLPSRPERSDRPCLPT